MKYFIKTLTLISIVIFAGSFKSKQGDNIGNYKNEGCFTAHIDGRMFDSRDHIKYTAEAINQSSDATAGISPDLTFFGSDRFDQNGNVFQESLEFKYTFNESTGHVTGQNIVFQFNNQKFSSVPGQTKIRITKIRFNADRSSFVMSADFEGKMLQCAAPGQAQAIVKVRGTMEDINVSVPSSSPKTAPQATAE